MTAKKIGLHGNARAEPPVIHIITEFCNGSGNLRAEGAREADRNGEAALLTPEIEAIQSAGLHINEHFIGGEAWFRKINQSELARVAVGLELVRFHIIME
jgi:hypothetical protein